MSSDIVVPSLFDHLIAIGRALMRSEAHPSIIIASADGWENELHKQIRDALAAAHEAGITEGRQLVAKKFHRASMYCPHCGRCTDPNEPRME